MNSTFQTAKRNRKCQQRNSVQASFIILMCFMLSLWYTFTEMLTFLKLRRSVPYHAISIWATWRRSWGLKSYLKCLHNKTFRERIKIKKKNAAKFSTQYLQKITCNKTAKNVCIFPVSIRTMSELLQRQERPQINNQIISTIFLYFTRF